MDSTGIIAEGVDHGINERFFNVGPEQFSPLVLEVMQQRSVSAAELARRLAISRTNLSRWLTRKRPLSAVTLKSIFLTLEIDELRAILAIGRFGRWQHYFDPDVRIISDLIDVLPDALNKARSGATRYAVEVSGAMELARRVSDKITTNDRETERRRLERPFAGM